MTINHDLSQLNSETFENLVNTLALKTLGLGASGFGPGSDGGRDGYFVGEAPYPSTTDRWNGTWYIQSKFYKPGGNKPENKWLIEQIKDEISQYEAQDSDRRWPDIWIVATNVDQSGKPETGSFDAIRELLSASPLAKKVKLAVWGGRKIIDLLTDHKEIAEYYGHFLTPGHVISKLYDELKLLSEPRASVEEIIRYFVVGQFSENVYTKLEQAGSSADIRPAVHDLFIDLPFTGGEISDGNSNHNLEMSNLLATLCSAAAQPQKYSLRKIFPESWRVWSRLPKRARVILIKGGPGQGKSTIGQYLCQIHRANLILASNGPSVVESIRIFAETLKNSANSAGFWPTTARIPIQIELKEFAHWHSQQTEGSPRNVLSYLASLVAKKISSEVAPRTLKLAMSKQSWLIVFDGLDEVPNDHKDEVAKQVVEFINDTVVEIDGDFLALCTSRPQGYSGQFSELDGAEVALARLEPEMALRCAKPLLRFGRSEAEGEKSVQTLEAAIRSPNIQELMTTPLQSHIMAVVVRDGGRPPERRWRLFQSFYQVMKRRESQKGFKDQRIANLLQGEGLLLKAVHMRLGFVLHARAERSSGAHTALSRAEFRELVHFVVQDMETENIDETVDVLMEATTERLVLVSTPDNGDKVRFDIRQLQEFFAAEFLYDAALPEEIASRIEAIGSDAHWREVVHFLLSALIADRRTTEFAVAVRELTKFNEGPGSSSEIYYRRTAPASLIALRILAEGVVEDDQKDRRNLKQIISDLGGVTDLRPLYPLLQLSLRNSRSWLISVLMERISISKGSEHVGALFVLGGLVKEMDEGAVSLMEAMEAMPCGLVEVLVSNWNSSQLITRGRNASSRNIGIWVLASLVKILNSEKSIRFSHISISQMISLLRENSIYFEKACTVAGLPIEVSTKISRTVLSPGKISHEITDHERAISCGLLDAFPLLDGWHTGKIPKHLKEYDAKSLLPFVGGLFKFILTCVWFGQRHSKEALLEFSRIALSIDPEYLRLLPREILAIVPVGNEQEIEKYSTAHLTSLNSKSDVKLFLKNISENIFPPCNQYMLTSSETAEDWVLLSTRLPRFALRFAFEEDGVFRKQPPIFVPELKNLMREYPVNAAEYILRWGILEESEAQLLQELCTGLKNIKIKKLDFSTSSEYAVSPFKLIIPDQIEVLPFLANALSSWMRGNREVNSAMDNSIILTGDLESLMTSYGLSVDILWSIAVEVNQAKIVRAGAAALYWLSAKRFSGALSIDEQHRIYNEVVDDDSQSWLTACLISGVLVHRLETDKNVISLASTLMMRNAEGSIQKELQPLLRAWRERSNAPITTHNLLSQWLGYRNNIPEYAR
jgi:hypothetical protein